MDGQIEVDFRTSDTDAAVEHLRQSYGRLSIRGPVDYGVSTVGDRRFSIGSVLLGGELSVSGIVDGFTVVTGPDRYHWQVDDERGYLGRDPILFHPHVPLQVHVDRVQVSAVRFDTRELERLARRAFDNPDLHLGFDGPRPISTPRRSVTSRGAAVSYRVAVAFIEENAGLPITVEDVAVAAGVSSMRLGQIFSQHASPAESPRACIRRMRLEAARRQMSKAAPGEMTLGDVAARWGFTQQGLVRHYRRAFGVDPRPDPAGDLEQ
ncbi:MAG: hypothetical protein DI573_13795 [Microbacterium sp.]|uniref:helix-turn-helix transcriptional regulator n=1 Tax=unclassified Microbacterium TaxID=2609290 RepID=UPI000DB0A7DF|nr:helix-turn-helix domain-containing protein [Microbacterium sp.]PZU36378.1 MAG: hypothetical protein DI573_13795 [Microbacterium sp.]